MRLKVKRKDVQFVPDTSKIIARYFMNGEDRSKDLVKNIMSLPEQDAKLLTNRILREFSNRHRNISDIFMEHFGKVEHLIEQMGIIPSELSVNRKLLIGSYFTMEYSVESAALFNPSIMIDPDQTGLEKGQTRIVVSLRATGEGHVSSIVFRGGIIDENNEINMMETGGMYGQAQIKHQNVYHKTEFLDDLDELKLSDQAVELVKTCFPDQFIYREIGELAHKIVRENNLSEQDVKGIARLPWLADSHYNLTFSYDTNLSERVIFPVADNESKGIEDARFVHFTNDDGTKTYYGTYTAYDGASIVPKIIQTDDFYHFRVIPIHGPFARNKNLALFPRKINGKYAMISRIDGVNNYIMFSDKINIWESGEKFQVPKNYWEFVQIGNGGSPIETKEGWLMITHGVGPMRKYCLGASLLDINDPSKEIGRLKEPLIVPNEEEREGYVPNVVYTCGGMIHNDELIIPYAMSDWASTCASIPLKDLMAEMVEC